MRALNRGHPLGFALVGALLASPLAAQDDREAQALEVVVEAVEAAMAEDRAKQNAEEAVEGTRDVQLPPPPPAIQLSPPPPAILPMSLPPEGPRKSTNPKPIGGQYNWFRGAVLPADLYLQEAQGAVRYEIAVDADGKATSCSVAESSGFPGLDDFTCTTAMKVAEFEPALDAEGNAIAGTFTDRHYWRYRKQELDSFSVTVSAIVRSDGTVLNCRVLNEEGALPKNFPGDKPCAGMAAGGPWRDANGEPKDRVVTFTLAVESEAPPEPLVIKRETPAD